LTRMEEVARVLTGEKLQVVGGEDDSEDTIDPSSECGVVGCDIVRPSLGEVPDC
jgi:hypothetical protein